MSGTFGQAAPTHARLAGTEINAFLHTATELELPAGTVLAEHELMDRFYVLLDGEVALVRSVDGGEEVVQAGDINPDDATPVILGTPPAVSRACVARDSRFLHVEADVYLEHIAGWSPANTIIVGSLAGRVHTAAALLRQQEKLAELGKLSAGLAHELNNPASAAQRAADHLRECLDILAAAGGQTTPRQPDALAEIEREGLDRRLAGPSLDPIALADREDEITSWLDARDIPDGWRFATSLAEAGLDVAWLETAEAQTGPDRLGAWLVQFEARLRAATLLDEIEQSSERISELVGALKSYTYRDQAPVQEVDIHQGLDNTLVILNHKLRGGTVVSREYDPNLPRVTAFGGELNQVWTNLIDNAIDALKGAGHIRIRTAHEPGQVVVEIADDGPGIPVDVQPHVFAPFVTTKAQGAGTGIGLHTAYNIVVQRHRGTLSFTSEPGATCFRVTLPVQSVGEDAPVSDHLEVS